MRIIHNTGSRFDLDESRAGLLLLEEILSRPLFAHLATAVDTVPRESPVWFMWEEEAVWIIGNSKTDSFPHRIEREPRCAIGIVDFDRTKGLVRHVGFRGRGQVLGHDKQRMIRLMSRYFGGQFENWDLRFVKILDDFDFIFIRFEPETAVVRDQSYQIKRAAEPC
jgi:hypothetical protein